MATLAEKMRGTLKASGRMSTGDGALNKAPSKPKPKTASDHAKTLSKVLSGKPDTSSKKGYRPAAPSGPKMSGGTKTTYGGGKL